MELSPLFDSPPCGVTQSDTPTCCPDCRDVPESDINSTRSSWLCPCDSGCDHHQRLCKQRHSARTVIRLASLQYELAMVFRSETMPGVVEDYMNVHPSAGFFKDKLPARILNWRSVERPAAEDPPIPAHLPEQVRLQAGSVENCINAISTTSPALAYWTEGMALKIQEAHVIPNPVKHIVLQHVDEDEFQRPADLHTIIVISPDNDNKEDTNSTWGQGCTLGEIWGDEGRVFDATHPQYDFDINCQKTSDYVWYKVMPEQKGHFVTPFGRCLRMHEEDRDKSPNVITRANALSRELGIRALNKAVYCETERLGGRQNLFETCSHEVFLQNQRQLVDAVREETRKARATVDEVAFRYGSVDQIEAALRLLLEKHESEEHQILMAAFEKRQREAK
ncbi:hypothetical protein P153DRAFT_390052 [Dothidotthia symphoricarpi CBS 119687]|uniref:Uncharacterized protein n=1 Tax=Dothidotthia symphoricarpi CBS 119687 TaxID=1392245 RepID=A0A6A6A203_9PLEO|nr:uncharacterized protein P153DRAFT_390052 [Dothidotthia symphoricarpi CBS 119687]KAF2125203.1 hypothetical protein P153DRAFT_390052 [Dothidotthia symphoricarpi CBS 119687]